MSAFDGDEGKREIIIVRRGGGDHEEGHHGGVWKIAFADFMTAMMCFFLVMWLINAANEESKSAIASYFNPMTLVDEVPATKGMDDPGQTPSATTTSRRETANAAEASNTRDQASGPAQNPNSIDQSETEQTSDQHLFSDPYAVLAEIAAETATLQNISDRGDGGAQTSGPATGAEGGESYRDPFAPDFWSQEVSDPQDDELAVFREQEPPAGTAEGEDATEPSPAEIVMAELAEETAAEQEQARASAQDTPAPAAQQEETVEAAASEKTRQLAEEIREQIAEAFGANAELNQAISVTARTEGVLISVTDELNYGMFQIGSAVPKPELVRAMEKIGRTLSGQQGRIRINGHTDGRPFRSADYDNWRLSTARAHAAYYMLVRGGMDESRIKEVAGFADRELKVPEDPLADANRRIEIFLEAGG